jgi:tRNA-splicing ligase RtcB
MRVDGILYGSETLLRDMDERVLEQLANVAALPGIVRAAYAMPDAHWGYGFPIGGVAAFDPAADGVISAGGVGFDISCGVRTLITPLTRAELDPQKGKLADALFRDIPAGVGETGDIRLDNQGLNAMLAGGARWAVERGYGAPRDLERIENNGCVAGAQPHAVSDAARRRQAEEMGTLGSGNHYLEVQEIVEICDAAKAAAFGLRTGGIAVSIHCGSRGLGHQVATDYAKSMVQTAAAHGLHLADRELACAPIQSQLGQSYLGAMRSAANCALANRQILAHLVRQTLGRLFPGVAAELLYDVSHNLCSVEEHAIAGRLRELFVHRKGATRAFGPGHPVLAPDLRHTGQPVLIGGTMGTASYILAGTEANAEISFSSACHGAGRAMSRSEATRKYRGEDVVRSLEHRNILIRSRSRRGIAEEAPGAYKDVAAVVEATARTGLATLVARLAPLICVKG